MSTRTNIELYDCWEDVGPDGQSVNAERRGVVLYHYCDGYPSWMGPELERLLKEVKAHLEKVGRSYWWDSGRVGALMVLFSGGSESSYGVPDFQPSLELQEDIEYLWRIYLRLGDGEYEIECFKVSWDWERGQVEHLEKVDWKEAVASEADVESKQCA